MAVLACVHHLERPSLGLAAEPLRAAGLTLDQRDLRRGDPLPALDQIDGLLTLGGEQSLREIERYPYIAAEAELLAGAVDRGLPTLGICLGGQLLALSQGAEIGHLPRRVIGWPEVSRATGADDDPLFGELPESFPALHWNEDYFTVPDSCVELLSRSDLGGEAFRAGERAWGTQFHPEAEESILAGWYERPQTLEQAGVSAIAAQAADAEHMPEQRRLARRLFAAFARLVAGG